MECVFIFVVPVIKRSHSAFATPTSRAIRIMPLAREDGEGVGEAGFKRHIFTKKSEFRPRLRGQHCDRAIPVGHLRAQGFYLGLKFALTADAG